MSCERCSGYAEAIIEFVDQLSDSEIDETMRGWSVAEWLKVIVAVAGIEKKEGSLKAATSGSRVQPVKEV
jgi:hypothetical protein